MEEAEKEIQVGLIPRCVGKLYPYHGLNNSTLTNVYSVLCYRGSFKQARHYLGSVLSTASPSFPCQLVLTWQGKVIKQLNR